MVEHPDHKARAAQRWPAVIGLVAFLAGIVVTVVVVRLLTPPPIATPAPATAPVAPAPVAAAPPPPGTDLASLSAREQALAARIELLGARLSSIEGGAREAAGYATRAEGLMVAFAARRALDRGLALGYVETQLRERFTDRAPAAVAAVLTAAREPVTIEDLRLALDTLAPQIVSGAPDEGILARLQRELGGLVVIREATKASPRPVDRLARARRALDAGNVEAALAEVSRLPGARQAESWMSAAIRYVEARRALNAIELAAIQGAPPAPPAAAPNPPSPTPLATATPGN